MTCSNQKNIYIYIFAKVPETKKEKFLRPTAVRGTDEKVLWPIPSDEKKEVKS